MSDELIPIKFSYGCVLPSKGAEIFLYEQSDYDDPDHGGRGHYTEKVPHPWFSLLGKIEIVCGDLGDSTHGYWLPDQRVIVLHYQLTYEQAFATLIHELTHAAEHDCPFGASRLFSKKLQHEFINFLDTYLATTLQQFLKLKVPACSYPST